MTHRQMPPVIDITLDGRPRPAPRVPFGARVVGVAVVVAVVCALLSVAALAIWVAAMLIPVALVAALVAWVALKLRRPRTGGPGAGFRPVVMRWPPPR